jgi:hypothetical protein
VPVGEPVVYYPRRSFDLWGARYFLLPVVPDWGRRDRGYAAFLDKTDLIYPASSALQEQLSDTVTETWTERQDWQLRRNRAAYPRAWLVHFAQIRPPTLDKETRDRRLAAMLYMNDPLWTERDRAVLDLRQMALIETDNPQSLNGIISRAPVGPAETVEVVKYEPQRVELRASLDRPGLVILADTFYPGWHLTIDGRPAPILRANRLMRGAAVPVGQHRLVYTYEPASIKIGAIVSTMGLVASLGLACLFWRDHLVLPLAGHSFPG